MADWTSSGIIDMSGRGLEYQGRFAVVVEVSKDGRRRHKFPGGSKKRRESKPEKTLHREIKEEINVRIHREVNLICTFDLGGHKKYFFDGTYRSGEPQRQESEIEELLFLTTEEILALIEAKDFAEHHANAFREFLKS